MAGEPLGVDRGRGDDEMQVIASIEQPSEIAEEEVDVEAALVRLIDDEGVVTTELRITLQFGEEDAVGHETDASRIGDTVVETDTEPDLSAKLDTELGGDSRSDRPRRHSPRLGVADHPVDAASRRQAQLR